MNLYHGLEAWSPPAPDDDADLTDEQTLTMALGWAILAPSGHNSQPWKLHQQGNVVEVSADRSKRLPVVDPDDRELIMSCAALTTHLELALAGLNRASQTDWLPPDGGPDMVARVKVLGKATPTTDDLTLFKAIPHRVTNRAPFRPLQIGVDVLLVAKHLVESHGAHLTFLTGETRATVADLIAQGDRSQMADKTFRHELAAWVHHNQSEELDGMRGYGFGIGDLAVSCGSYDHQDLRCWQGSGGEGSPAGDRVSRAGVDRDRWRRTGRLDLCRARRRRDVVASDRTWLCGIVLESTDRSPGLADQVGCHGGNRPTSSAPVKGWRTNGASAAQPAATRRVDPLTLRPDPAT